MIFRPRVVIYHDKCDDGFGAAWAAWRRWGAEGIEYLPMQYGNPLPTFDAACKDVLVCDFSLTHEQCEALTDQGARILMLDHHKTAAENLKGLPQIKYPDPLSVTRAFVRMESDPTLTDTQKRVLVEFDMNRSGARMTWEFAFCMTQIPVPELIHAIEDRDLWRFQRGDTKLVSLYIRSLPRDFRAWQRLAIEYEQSPDVILDRASAIKAFYDIQIEEICDAARLERFLNEHDVPVARSCPYGFVSDVCHTLLDRYPDAPFAVAAVQAHGATTYSLRSRDGRADVSAIAQAQGGGGHRNAAGFRMAPEGGTC